MTIYEFRELFIDERQMCYIWALESEEEIFRGQMSDVPEEIEDIEISSLDNIYPDNKGYIGINIDI